MKFPIIIKQSPLVLIKRIIEIELSISIILFLVSFIANYQQLYQDSFIGEIFRYDLFLVVVVSVAQLIITLITFLTWHNEEYRVKEKEVIHRYGFMFSKEKSILLKNVTSIEYKRSPIEFLLSVGTISISMHNSPKPFLIRSIESAEIYSNIIKDAVDRALQRPAESLKKLSILDLILEGEHSHLEFKQTFRWDGRQKITSKPLEKAVMKTIAAFLNSGGGTLLIGVTDGGKIFGLNEDYNSLVRKDRDGFENHLNQILKNMIGAEFRQYVTVAFETIETKDVCLVEVRGSPKPVYVKANGEDEEFFIRTGNTTSALSLSETHSYIETHWER
jgi:membrane protein YdbS with pleckstrin-like domain